MNAASGIREAEYQSQYNMTYHANYMSLMSSPIVHLGSSAAMQSAGGTPLRTTLEG